MNIEKLTTSNILNTLKLTSAPRDIQDHAIQDAKKIIIESAHRRIQAIIPPKDQEGLARVLRDGTDDERAGFLHDHGIDLQEIIQQETLRYKYLAEIMAIQDE